MKRISHEYIIYPQCKHEILHIARDWDHYCDAGKVKK